MTSFSPNPNVDRYYVAYLSDDPSKEPIAVGYSITGTMADAAERTCRSRNDFEVQEITRKRFERLKSFV
ncbi:MAG: hypothetical protein JO333_13065 [Verrucomicrobia bacterium]|nr:hypothetical protein [Verrucomicrobiota bacterium]